MTEQHNDSHVARIEFPPIPLLSGNAFEAESREHFASAVTVVVQSEDGVTIEVPLDFRFGGWWAPVDAGRH